MESEDKNRVQEKGVDIAPLRENSRRGMELLSKQQPTTFEKAKEQAERVRNGTLSSSKKQ
jgi:hypothetical protein